MLKTVVSERDRSVLNLLLSQETTTCPLMENFDEGNTERVQIIVHRATLLFIGLIGDIHTRWTVSLKNEILWASRPHINRLDGSHDVVKPNFKTVLPMGSLALVKTTISTGVSQHSNDWWYVRKCLHLTYAFTSNFPVPGFFRSRRVDVSTRNEFHWMNPQTGTVRGLLGFVS